MNALIVHNFPCDVLLGNKFCDEEGVDILYSKKEVFIHNDSFPLPSSFTSEEPEKLLYVQEVTTIPANSEKAVKVMTSLYTDQDILIEPLTNTFEKYGLLVSKTLIRPKEGQGHIRVMNPTTRKITLEPKTKIAKSFDVLDVLVLDQGKKEEKIFPNKIQIPEHLEPNEKNRMSQLLSNFADIMSTDKQNECFVSDHVLSLLHVVWT